MGLELKKEKVELSKKKGEQLKTYSINVGVFKLQDTVPKKKNASPSYPETHKRSKESSKEKYISDDNLKVKITGVLKNFAQPNKAEQPEESRIVLMDIDPYSLHAYWEITHIFGFCDLSFDRFIYLDLLFFSPAFFELDWNEFEGCIRLNSA